MVQVKEVAVIGDIVGSLVGPITGLLDKVVEDKDKKAQLAHEIATMAERQAHAIAICLLYTSPSPRDRTRSRMPSSA